MVPILRGKEKKCFKKRNFVPKGVLKKKNPGMASKMLGEKSIYYPYQKLLPGVQGGGFLEKNPPGRRRQDFLLGFRCLVLGGKLMKLFFKTLGEIGTTGKTHLERHFGNRSGPTFQ